MYSQNNEEQIIVKYFGEFKGTFLDIGAHDGITLSNTRALTYLGWNGICIEPSPEIFQKLLENNLFEKVKCYQFAIGESNNTVVFYNNPEFYSTMSETDRDKWANAGQKFTAIEVQQVDFKTFLEKSDIKTFDFISIDAEGVDWEILQQIDLKEIGCKMICVEHNSIDTVKYYNYISKFGFKEIGRNAENILMAL